MKLTQRLVLTVAALFTSAHVIAQCSANSAFSNAPYGFYPYGPILADCTGMNADVTIVGRTDTVFDFGGTIITVSFDAMRLDTIIGLPPGLTVETDVMASATTFATYGMWLFSGSLPSFQPSFGCMRITGSTSAWANAATGGPNGDGVYPLQAVLDFRFIDSDPESVLLFPPGEWNSQSGPFAADVFDLTLNVNGTSCGASLFVTPQVTANTDTTQGCDGSVSVSVYGGQPPFTYAYSTGQSTPSVGGLCPGIYSVDVTDANGTTGSAQFAVGVQSNVYSNIDPAQWSALLDSVFATTQNCDLDFTLPVDSFMVTEAYLSGPDTLLVQWVAYQLGQPYTLQSFYPAPASNETILSLVIFCENGRSQVGVFQLFEYIDLNSNVGIDETDRTLGFSIQPNPSAGLFTLVSGSVEDITAKVIDVAGKVVCQKQFAGANAYELNLLSAKTGMYFLYVESAKGRSCHRLVKQ